MPDIQALRARLTVVEAKIVVETERVEKKRESLSKTSKKIEDLDIEKGAIDAEIADAETDM